MSHETLDEFHPSELSWTFWWTLCELSQVRSSWPNAVTSIHFAFHKADDVISRFMHGLRSRCSQLWGCDMSLYREQNCGHHCGYSCGKQKRLLRCTWWMPWNDQIEISLHNMKGLPTPKNSQKIGWDYCKYIIKWVIVNLSVGILSISLSNTLPVLRIYPLGFREALKTAI